MNRPTTNSDGSPINNPTAFWEWFGNSVMVDDQGRPKVYYHASYVDFEEFQHPWEREDSDEEYFEEGYSGGNLGIGFYFTDDLQYANSFGNPRKFYLKITNPMDANENADLINELHNDEDNEWVYGTYGEVIDQLCKENHYDGVIGDGVGGLSYGASEVMVLKADRIKSVDNKGSYKGSNIFESQEDKKMVFWHGGDLSEYRSGVAHKKCRFEYGPGLYLTTHYMTANKYAKGSRKLYQVTISPGVEIMDAMIPVNNAVGFVKTYAIVNRQKKIIDTFTKYIKDEAIPAYIFVNVLLNEDAIKPKNTNDFRKFLVSSGVDYQFVQNAFGWGETMLVLFNVDKIENIRQMKPTDKEFNDFDPIK